LKCCHLDHHDIGTKEQISCKEKLPQKEVARRELEERKQRAREQKLQRKQQQRKAGFVCLSSLSKI
jgi:hypothetical protein